MQNFHLGKSVHRVTQLLKQLEPAFVDSRLIMKDLAINEFCMEKLLPFFAYCKHYELKIDCESEMTGQSSTGQLTTDQTLVSLLHLPSIENCTSLEIEFAGDRFFTKTSMDAISNWLHKPVQKTKYMQQRTLKIISGIENFAEMEEHLIEVMKLHCFGFFHLLSAEKITKKNQLEWRFWGEMFSSSLN